MISYRVEQIIEKRLKDIAREADGFIITFSDGQVFISDKPVQIEEELQTSYDDGFVDGYSQAREDWDTHSAFPAIHNNK